MRDVSAVSGERNTAHSSPNNASLSPPSAAPAHLEADGHCSNGVGLGHICHVLREQLVAQGVGQVGVRVCGISRSRHGL